MAKVAFISHASEDAAIATTITEYLERNGVPCWLAPRDATPGSDYSAEIIGAIEASAVFVLVLSENANDSTFVKREVERAVSKDKPVFPLRVREVMPSRSLELFISSPHWIDAWKPPLEDHLERLARSITTSAAVNPTGTPAPVAPPAQVGSFSAAVRHRRLHAAAIVLLILASGGWYAYSLLAPSAPVPPSAAVAVGGGTEPAAEPALGRTAVREIAAAPASSPTDRRAPELCPRTLLVNPNLPMPFTCACSAEATRNGAGMVLGTDVYADLSDLCRAALHAGAVAADGGPVTVLHAEGRPIYAGSVRNGVTSNDFGNRDRSITFAGGLPAKLGPELCPRILLVNPNLPMPFTCACSAEATRNGAGMVFGTDVYADLSDLCRAALHAGAVAADGGPVTVLHAEGRPIYAGSVRNGVTSNDFGNRDRSIRFR
jgi:hypothetical protein